jgi:hypothetical protein
MIITLTDLIVLVLNEFQDFYDLFWRLPSRGGSQNRQVIKFLESSSVPCQGDMAHKFVG